MSDQSAHPQRPAPASDLDASVDALAEQLAAHNPAPAVATLEDTPIPSPPDSGSPDALLSEIADEIERSAPGPLPTPPEPPPVARPAPQPSVDDIAAAAAEVDADLSFEPPAEHEIAAPVSPAPSSAPAAAQPLPSLTGAPSVDPERAPDRTSERPGPEMKKLDAALAAGAERALASAAREEPKPRDAVSPVAEEEEFVPDLPAAPQNPDEPIDVPVAQAAVERAAPKAAPAPVAPPVAPDKRPAPKVATSTVVIGEPAAPEAAPAPAGPGLRTRVARALALPLRPLALVHEKFSEPTRQTIAYCAVITLFFAACVWGRVIFFPAKQHLEPTGEAAEFYDDTTPAHGITSPAKPAPEGGHGEAGHGESGGGHDSGHGEAKKPAKSSSKKSDAHGDGGHGSGDSHAAKPEKKSSSKSRKTASADAHGGH